MEENGNPGRREILHEMVRLYRSQYPDFTAAHLLSRFHTEESAKRENSIDMQPAQG